MKADWFKTVQFLFRMKIAFFVWDNTPALKGNTL